MLLLKSPFVSLLAFNSSFSTELYPLVPVNASLSCSFLARLSDSTFDGRGGGEKEGGPKCEGDFVSSCLSSALSVDIRLAESLKQNQSNIYIYKLFDEIE